MKRVDYPLDMRDKIEAIRASMHRLEEQKGVEPFDVDFVVVRGRPAMTCANEFFAIAERLVQLAAMQDAP